MDCPVDLVGVRVKVRLGPVMEQRGNSRLMCLSLAGIDTVLNLMCHGGNCTLLGAT